MPATASELMAGSRRRMGRSSIRLRVTALAAVVVGLVLAATAVALVLLQERQLTEAVDATLRQRADEIESMLGAGTEPGDSLLGTGTQELLAQLVAGDGRVVAATHAIRGLGPLADPPASREAVRNVDNLAIEDDVFRLLSRTVEGGMVLHLAANLDEVRDGTEVLVNSLAVIVPTVVAVLALVIWWLVGRTLRPVDAIESEVRSITADQLGRRVPEPSADDEIGRLAATMNEMLDRVDRAVAAQRRFVADASHELRSPLTRIRAELEVAGPDGGDPELVESLHEEVVALQAMVEDLLHLARSDAGVQTVKGDLVDLDDVVRESVAYLGNNGARVETELENVVVRGSRDQYARVVRNLLDNAARYAAGHVRVTTALENGWAVLTVADDGPGIPPEAVDEVFERFVRLDESRSAGGGGAGLGLAIARDIVERHGGSIQALAGAGGRFVVRLPAE